MGSLGADTEISAITFRNVYTWNSNQMMFVKSNGGSGTVSDVTFENFIGEQKSIASTIHGTRTNRHDWLGHGNAYSFNIDSYWSSMSSLGGKGVELSNFTIKNWKGTEANGAERGPIKIICPDGVPCYDINIEDFAMWTEEGDKQTYVCQNAYGSGFCLQEGSGDSDYAATTSTATQAPSGYSAATMASDLTANFGSTVSIPIPTVPTSFYPGVTPVSALMAGSTSSSVDAREAVVATSSTKSTAATQKVDRTSEPTAKATSGSSEGEFPAAHFWRHQHHHGHF